MGRTVRIGALHKTVLFYFLFWFFFSAFFSSFSFSLSSYIEDRTRSLVEANVESYDISRRSRVQSSLEVIVCIIGLSFGYSCTVFCFRILVTFVHII